MDCQEVKESLYPFLDGELEAKLSLEVEEHLQSCPLCSLKFESEKKIESIIKEKVPRDKAPLALKERIIEEIERAKRRSSFRRPLHSFLQAKPKHAFAILTILALVISLPILYHLARSSHFPILTEVVNYHVDFLANRLPLEITSSDPDEVTSWFEGKLDFSVSALQFPDEKTTLLGGRLGHLRDRDAAYIVYKRGRRKLSFFIFDWTGITFPRAKKVKVADQEFHVTSLKGYIIIHWVNDELGCIVVSDIDNKLLLELLSKALPGSA